MNESQFLTMFKLIEFSDVILFFIKTRKKNLFTYFSNCNKTLKVNKFIEKYCILIKSDPLHFTQIIHRVFCKAIDFDKMTYEDFRAFEDECHKYIKEYINITSDKFPISWSLFF